MAELSTGSNKIFLSINGNGKLAKKATENTPGAVLSVYNAGTPSEKKVWQLEFDSIKGHVTSMYYHMHTEYGESLNVVIDDEYILQLKVGNRYYYSFVKAAPNVDFTQPIRFNPWRKEEGGKVKQALYLNQGDGKDSSIPWAFTKDQPNGMPEMEKVTFKGKDEWDDTKLRAFCKELIEKTIKPRIPGTRSGAVDGNAPAGNQPAQGQNTAAGAMRSGTPQGNQYIPGNFSQQPADSVDDLPF